jgi:glyoxylate reductase
LNSIGAIPNITVCTGLGSDIAGGRLIAVPGSTGPAGDGAAAGVAAALPPAPFDVRGSLAVAMVRQRTMFAAVHRRQSHAVARCFVSRRLPGPALQRLAAGHELDVWPERLPPTPTELAARVAGVDGLLSLLTDRVDAALLAVAPRLRVISNYAVGVDNIDLAAASARGIPVGHTPDVLTDATADMTFALLLASARKLPDAIAAARSGDWLTWEPGEHLGASVHGATLGIIGFGRIGRAVAQRAEGFEMTVLHTPTSSEAGVSLPALLDRSDFVTLHCPLTPDTRGLIGADAFQRMRPTAILINTARGPLVDSRALADALATAQIAGAALDVTDPEPLPADDPLFSAPNLIVTPHVGSATRAARERMAELAVDNLLAGLDGRPMPHQANAL